MRRLAALLLTLLLLLAACGADPEPTPEAAGPDPAATPADPIGDDATAPSPPPSPSPTTAAEGAGTPAGDQAEPTDGAATGATEARAYLTRADDSGFWVEPVTAPLSEPTVAVARAAFELMVRGESPDPELHSLTGAGVEVLDVRIDGGTLVIDLSGALRDNRTGASGEAALAQQLAHTGAQFDTVDRVLLHLDGAPISELWGHLDWSEPVEPDPFALSPITFDSHTWGEQIPVGEVTVGGEANTFEATVQLRLLGPNGDVIEETFTTATSGSGERGTWEHTFFFEGAATWTVEATEPDPSDGEGRPPFTTSLQLRSS
jgi:hypothetical protein